VWLQRAKEVLAASDTPIERVAHAVGFADRAYFSRAFRRSEGVSPLQYRRAKQSPQVF
jgi:transcriptional regulator GlxA family with amidase domain